MSIEINGSQGRAPVEIGDSRKAAQPNTDEAASNTPTKSSGSGSDKLSLTSSAVQLRALQDQITELPVVDTQRVQEVQRSLATGSFQVDPARVADKMLQFESGLNGGN